jgi:DNA repair exonuclease SbcCD ATPase subunit
MSDDLVKRLRASLSMLAQEEAADRIEELEAQIKKDALQYLSDTGQMGETIGDLTRRHEHAMRKIEELEERLKAATDDAKEAEAYAVQMEVMLESAEQQGYANAMEAERKRHEARIEELEAELHLMKTSGIAEVAARNPSVMEYMRHWEGRTEAAEAKLRIAMAALDVIIRFGNETYPDPERAVTDMKVVAERALQRIEGDE